MSLISLSSLPSLSYNSASNKNNSSKNRLTRDYLGGLKESHAKGPIFLKPALAASRMTFMAVTNTIFEHTHTHRYIHMEVEPSSRER